MMDYHPRLLGRGAGGAAGGGGVGSNNRCFMLENLGLTLGSCELNDLSSFTLRVMNTFSYSPGISLF